MTESGTQRNTRLRRRAVLICIATTVVVATVELLVGWQLRLISITAEGLHTAADLADSVIVFLLVVVASQPADRRHPYGHGKFDSLGGLIEGLFVGITAVWSVYKASLVLLQVTEASPLPEPVAVLVMAVAALLYFGVSRYVLHLAEETGSPAVRAEALHLGTHIYITGGLAVAVILSRVALNYGRDYAGEVDAMAALLLGGYLLTVSYRIMRPALSQLMDSSLPEGEVDRITACLGEFNDEFIEVHAIRTRQSGTDRHVDIHLMVDPETTVRRAHDLSHRIEDRLKRELPGTDLLVHIEPGEGEPMQAYLDRQRVGAVVPDPPGTGEHEATHHQRDDAHAPPGESGRNHRTE